QPALLTAREILDRRRELRAREAHAFEHLPRREVLRLRPAAHGEARAKAADHDADGLVEMLLELIEALRERRDLDGLASLDTTARGFDAARDKAEQGRLAGAVHAENAG